MWRGEKVEEGPVEQIFARPVHPYTRMLLSAVPRLRFDARHRSLRKSIRFHSRRRRRRRAEPARGSPQAAASEPLLKVRGLTTRFDVEAGLFGRVTRRVHAVEQVSFDLHAGETLALVGESGCGKSTTGRSLLRLVDVTGGSIEFDGT